MVNFNLYEAESGRFPIDFNQLFTQKKKKSAFSSRLISRSGILLAIVSGTHNVIYSPKMHENVNLSMLKTLSDQKSAIPDDDELQRIQNLRQHRDTLSELEEFLDEVRD